MSVFYNDFSQDAYTWLRGLVKAGLLPHGDISTTPIELIKARDARFFNQCHFFCGIGGWPLALKLAGVPEDVNIWTGSCPCQPFSVAGKGEGLNDERDLWSTFASLIGECKPDFVVGEQVEAAIRHDWYKRLCEDLMHQGYGVLGAVLSANIIGSPHVRKRLYWFAYRKEAVENTDVLRRTRWLPVGDPSWCLAEVQGNGEESVPSSFPFWSDGEWVEGTEGQSFALQPGSFPLVDGVPNKLVKCVGYGNAIVPQLGALFLLSCFDTLKEIYN